MRTNLTDISIVLDRSGSMMAVHQDTIGGFNTFLETQQREPGEATLTLMQFDTEFELVHNGKKLGEVPPLTEATFVPRGYTALLDAIGQTINATGARLAAMPEAERPGKVLFVIITDGEENSSKEFTLARVHEMIELQRSRYQWEFVFLGANQDAIKSGADLGIPATNSLRYSATGAGTRRAFGAVAQVASNYRAGQDISFTDEDRKVQGNSG